MGGGRLTSDYFQVLGVSRFASSDEISAAYRQLARTFHPDAHPDANAAERSIWTTSMARISEAYDFLKDPSRRVQLRRELEADAERSTHDTRPPSASECFLCGCSPSTLVTFRYQNAYLLASTIYSFAGRVCRDCGQALGRTHQNRTLMTGWWGIVPSFRNIAYIMANSKNLAALAHLGNPQRSRDVAGPLAFPLQPGRNLLYRPGVWVAAAIATGLLIVGAAVGRSRESSDATYNAPSSSASWIVGNCVSGTSLLSPVPCTDPHTGAIVAMPFSEAGCPIYAEVYVELRERVACIDDDR